VSTPIVSVESIEVPFNQRHCCWFCGEPSSKAFTFPKKHQHLVLLSLSHPRLSMPSCTECYKIANSIDENSIWSINKVLKQKLIKRYAKHLAIGINWTKEELASSEFEGGNFEDFARSAWFMFEVAKSRVNFIGWPVVVQGIEIEEYLEDEVTSSAFHFDGLSFPTIADAIHHYCEVFLLDKEFFSLVYLYFTDGETGSSSFAKAIRFCRLLVNDTKKEKYRALRTLQRQSTK